MNPSQEAVKHSDTLTVLAVAATAFGISFGLHELSHGLTSGLLGGKHILVTSNQTVGDFREISNLGLVIAAAAGSAANWILALAGFILLNQSKVKSAATRFFLLLMFGFNASIAATYMTFSPLWGYGDWMQILRMFSDQVIARSVVVVAGLFALWGLYNVTRRTLAQFVKGAPDGETRTARKLALTGLSVAGVMAVVAGLLTPLNMQPGLGLVFELGNGIGAGSLLLIASYSLPSNYLSNKALSWRSIQPSVVWRCMGIIVLTAFVLGLGRGMSLAGYSFGGVNVPPLFQ